MNTGLGIRPELFYEVLEHRPQLGFLEAHSENYFGESLSRSKLLQCRQHYPVSLHGVGLSLGRADSLDPTHLQQLKNLVEEVQPVLVSEHLSWSAFSHIYLPDLLPLPLTEESFTVMCSHVQQMQDALQCQILIENPSNYLLFDQLQIPEPEFLNALADRTGCGLLLDVNNIYVSATNLDRDPHQYIQAIDSGHVRQYHLAGHTQSPNDGGCILIDTHNREVSNEVWDLYRLAIERHGNHPCLIEWDSDYPPFSVLRQQCRQADYIASTTAGGGQSGSHTVVPAAAHEKPELAGLQESFLQLLLQQGDEFDLAVEPHRKRIRVYRNNIFSALFDYLSDVYPAVKGVVGERYFKQMAHLFAQLRPPRAGNIHTYGADFQMLLQELPVLTELPYLRDLMDFEWALHVAYFAPVEASLDPDCFNRGALLELPVRLKQDVTFIDSCYPVVQIRRQSLPGFAGEVDITLEQSKDKLLIYKRQGEVLTQSLNPAEAAFLRQLNESANLIQAIEGLGELLPMTDISAALARVFELQILTQSRCGLH